MTGLCVVLCWWWLDNDVFCILFENGYKRFFNERSAVFLTAWLCLYIVPVIKYIYRQKRLSKYGALCNKTFSTILKICNKILLSYDSLVTCSIRVCACVPVWIRPLRSVVHINCCSNFPIFIENRQTIAKWNLSIEYIGGKVSS